MDKKLVFLLIILYVGVFILGCGIGEVTTHVKCDVNLSGTTCDLYRRGVISEEGFVELLELKHHNCAELLKVMDECIAGLSNRSDTVVVCDELFNEK